jgi:hypothetical protein
MKSLKTKILLLILLLGMPLIGHTQSFMHSYVDPCTGEYKTLMADMNSPIIVTYYGQIKSFSFEEVSRGDLEFWMNDIYQKYKDNSPCQGAAITTTTTSTTIQAITLVNNITNITSLDFSTLTSTVGNVKVDIGSTTNQGSTTTENNKQETTNGSTKNGTNSSSSNGSNSTTKNDNTEKGGGVNNDNNTNNGSGSSGSRSNGNNNNGSANGGSNNSDDNGSASKEKETPTDGEITDTKTDAEKQQSQQVTKSTSKAKTDVQKPAILVTGDIVGIQNTNSNQDARGTMSFTRVKGDGTSSLGGSIDYMVNARIGNFSLMKSWISTNEKGHKGINVVSNSFTLLPGTWSNTAMFVRVNSLKKFTALYGAAATYGVMFDEPLINTLAIGGFMYKGNITKSINATVIMVGVYSPYMKYYTESILEQQPIMIPFLNLTWKMTKTFGFGLTGGGTYIAGDDQPLNYQVLMGCKLII